MRLKYLLFVIFGLFLFGFLNNTPNLMAVESKASQVEEKKELEKTEKKELKTEDKAEVKAQKETVEKALPVSEKKINLTAEELNKLIESIEDPKKREDFLANLKTIQKTVSVEDENATSEPSGFSLDNIMQPVDQLSKKFVADLIQFGDEVRGFDNFFGLAKGFFQKKENTSALFKFLIKTAVVVALLLALIAFNRVVKSKRAARRKINPPKSHAVTGLINLIFDALPFLLFLFVIAPLAAETVPIGSQPELVKVMAGVKRLLIAFLYIFVFTYFLMAIYNAVLAPNNEAERILPISNESSGQLYKFLRTLTIYYAVFSYLKYGVLGIWPNSIFYNVIGRILIIPIPIIFTVYFLRLKRLWASEKTEGALAESFFGRLTPYVKKYWFLPTLIYVWLVSLLHIIGLGHRSELFVGGVLGSLGAILLVFFIGYLVAYLLNKFLPQTIKARQTLIKTGQWVAYALSLPLMLFLILMAWGLPLSDLYAHHVASLIIGRLLSVFALFVLAVALIKTSNIIVEWILSIKEQSRLWVTLTPISHSVFKTLVVFVIVVSVLDRIGINVGPILAGAGILGLGVGMGAQTLVKDVINGLSLILSDIVSIGDVVSAGAITGTVEAVGLRSMRIRDVSGNLSVVPNSSIIAVTNMTKTFSQELVHLEVDYNTDLDLAYKVILETAQTLEADKNYAAYFKKPIEIIGVQELGHSGIIIRTRITTGPGDQWTVAREFRKRIVPAFNKNNIEIPFQQFVIHQSK